MHRIEGKIQIPGGSIRKQDPSPGCQFPVATREFPALFLIALRIGAVSAHVGRFKGQVCQFDLGRCNEQDLRNAGS